MDIELFNQYEKIRQSGKYNMIMDATAVMSKMKLNPRHKSDINKYLDIVHNYDAYSKEAAKLTA